MLIDPQRDDKGALLVIDGLAVGDARDGHGLSVVVNEVNDAVVSDTDAPLVTVA